MEHARRRARRRLGRAALAVLVAAAGLGWAGGSPAVAAELYAESFANATAASPPWHAPSTQGTHQPCLTAATRTASGSLPACKAVVAGTQKADAAGSGAFQVTNNATYEAGALLLNSPIQAGKGLHIEFDMYQYAAKLYDGRGGDGLSFFLIDGAQSTVSPGEPGGKLGYKGIKGAIIGIGFDEYGNFSSSTATTSGTSPFSTGPGLRKNNVVLRGAESTGYKYIQGIEAPAKLAVDAATSRGSARRTVNIDVSTTNVLSLYIDFNDGSGRRKLLDKIELDHISGQPMLPPTIKLGFSAATGAATANHEIEGFKVTTLDPDLNIKMTTEGPFKQGTTGTFVLNVADNAADGPTTGPVTTRFTVPSGLTAKTAGGDGWDCTISGQNVTCTRPDVLQPGAAYPPIKVTTAIPADAPSQVTAQAAVDTPGEHRPADNATSLAVPIAPNPPDVSIKVTPAGPFQAGGTGVITAVATDDPDAGPAGGPTTITVPAPPGTTVVGATGDGWTCTSTAAKATCTRPDPLQPGQSFPPVKVTVTIPPNAPDSVTLGGTVDEPGDGNLPNNTAPAVTVPVLPAPPDLAIAIQPSGGFVAGANGTLTTTVTNSDKAGATTGQVKVAIPVPSGVSVVSASGNGWTCSTGADTVTCTRPGTGTDALQPGTSYPPIVVSTKAAPVQVSGTVTTPGDSDTTDNKTTVSTRLR